MASSARTEELTDIVEWLGELVRQVDSSLLDEWEQLTSPDQPLDAPVAVPARPRPLTGNERAFTAMVRNALFKRVELFARRRSYDLGQLDADSGWTAERWEDAIHAYFAEHDDVGIGADARGPALLIIDRRPDVWRVRQILDDPAGDHDWGFEVGGRPGGLGRGGYGGPARHRRRTLGLARAGAHQNEAVLVGSGRLDVFPRDRRAAAGHRAVGAGTAQALPCSRSSTVSPLFFSPKM